VICSIAVSGLLMPPAPEVVPKFVDERFYAGVIL